ncbi:MAG: tetratricopeptide repeat protein, partial [Gammaproteobacteria bacterium]
MLLIQRNLAEALLALDELERAEALLRDGLDAAQASLPPDNVRLAYLHRSLGRLRARQGRDADAQLQYRRAHAIYARAFGDAHPATRELYALLR